MEHLKPLGHNVVLKLDAPVEKTESGILIAEAKHEVSINATVVAVGADVTDVMVGNRVLITKYCGNDIKFEGEDLRVVKDEEIVAVWEA